MVYELYRLASKKKDNGITWSPCGEKVVIKETRKFLKSIAMRMRRPFQTLNFFLDKLRRLGFTDYTLNRSVFLAHPFFLRGNKDLLTYFTLKNEFCWVQGICTPQKKSYKPKNKLDELKLELFDMGTELFDLRNDCLDLNYRIKDMFEDINKKT